MSESVSQGGALCEALRRGAGRGSRTGCVVTTCAGDSSVTVVASAPVRGRSVARTWCRTWCVGTGERSPSACGSENGSLVETGVSSTGSGIAPSTGTTIAAGGAAAITGCGT
jgi:hypothetical protein